MKVNFLTPVGRMVQGDPFEKQTKNQQGLPLMTTSGQPTQRYFCALAFPKVYPAGHPQAGQPNAEFAALYAQLDQVAKASFPGMNILPPWDPNSRFSWKVMDGDGVDDNGKPNANKPGFAGHWIVKFQSSFQPRCFYAGRHSPADEISDPNAYKRGWYYRVAGSIEGNGNTQKPGVYVNLSLVELVGGGPDDIIVSGPDAASVFGGSAAVLPTGVAPLPMQGMAAAVQPPAGLPGLPAALPAAGVPGLPAALPGVGLPAVPGAGSAPAGVATGMLPPGGAPVAPPVAVAPNPAFLGVPGTAAASPALPGLPPPPIANPAVPQLTQAAKDQGYTYEMLRQHGLNDEQMRAHGLLA